MGDWLGTGNLAPQNQKFDYKASLIWCQKIFNNYKKEIKKKSKNKNYREKFHEILKKYNIKKPDNVTSNPGYNFKNHPNYFGEGPFFGWSRRVVFKRWTFEKSRKFVRKLDLKSKSEWILYSQNKLKEFKIKPLGIPSSPQTVYSNKWKGWGDWLGTFNLKGAQKGNKNASD